MHAHRKDIAKVIHNLTLVDWDSNRRVVLGELHPNTLLFSGLNCSHIDTESNNSAHGGFVFCFSLFSFWVT